MLRPRVIPSLLLLDGRLVKTKRFSQPVYVGDPINVVRIFNEKEVDELMVIDIGATSRGRAPALEMLGRIVSEAFMPVSYGGGIASIETMQQLFRLGIEKVLLNSAAFRDPGLVTRAAERFGQQAIVVAIDVRKRFWGAHEAFVKGGRERTRREPVALARAMEEAGAGEILLTSIDQEGTRKGYDLGLIRSVSSALGVPLIACGGASNENDLRLALAAGAAGCAVGSMFVFQERTGAVLISYVNLGAP